MVNLFRYKFNCRYFLLFLCSLIISFKSFGLEITTGNLLPNSGDGVDWGSSSTDQIHPDSGSGYVSNGSTINGFDILVLHHNLTVDINIVLVVTLKLLEQQQ